MPRPSLALARDPNFRALWFGQLISIFGDRFTYLALLAVIVARARTPENPAAELALLPLVSFLPAILFGPWIGAWIDRNDTRRVLIASDAARGVVVLAMIPATLAGGLPALFALVFLLYVANTFFLPARSAIMPLLVPEERLTEANSLATFAGVAATIGGSLAGGFLVARFGWRWGFALDAATYFVSVVALWMIRIPPRTGAARPAAGAAAALDAAARYRRLLADVREGCAILLRTPRAWGAVGATMLLWMAGGVLHVAVPILIGGGGGAAAARGDAWRAGSGCSSPRRPAAWSRERSSSRRAGSGRRRARASPRRSSARGPRWPDSRRRRAARPRRPPRSSRASSSPRSSSPPRRSCRRRWGPTPARASSRSATWPRGSASSRRRESRAA